jgi:PAT family beta-lactamase induction signal transducer AmpG
MTDSRLRMVRLSLFSSVYFVEGAVLTYFSAFNVLYLRSFKLSYSLIGIVGGIMLVPFVLKIFIGLLSDKVNLFGFGYRKPYIVGGLVLQSAAFLLIPLIDPGKSFPLYVLVMIAASLGMSTYDTTTDGLSLDSTLPADRGLVQGLMVGGRALGSVITATIMGFLSAAGHWPMIFIMMAVLGLLTLVPAFLVDDKRGSSALEPLPADVRGGFKNLSFVLFLLLGIVYPLALYSAQGMIGAFLKEGMGVSLSSVGLYTSVFGIGTIVGGLVGGPLLRKAGERSSLLLAIAVTSLVTFAMALAPSAGLLWVIVFVFGLAFGYYETVYFAMGMEYSNPRIAAFMFAFIMAVGNIGIGLGQPLAGILVDTVGFRSMFGAFGAVHLLALPLVFLIFRIRRTAVAKV